MHVYVYTYVYTRMMKGYNYGRVIRLRTPSTLQKKALFPRYIIYATCVTFDL